MSARHTQQGYRDPFDDEELDFRGIKVTRGGAAQNLPVIATGPVKCRHCGGAAEFQHDCEEKTP